MSSLISEWNNVFPIFILHFLFEYILFQFDFMETMFSGFFDE